MLGTKELNQSPISKRAPAHIPNTATRHLTKRISLPMTLEKICSSVSESKSGIIDYQHQLKLSVLDSLELSTSESVIHSSTFSVVHFEDEKVSRASSSGSSRMIIRNLKLLNGMKATAKIQLRNHELPGPLSEEV